MPPASPTATNAAAALNSTMSLFGPLMPVRMSYSTSACAAASLLSGPSNSCIEVIGSPAISGKYLAALNGGSVSGSTLTTSDSPVSVSSSIPSRPCTTNARRVVPSSTRVRAIKRARLGASTPITCARAPAGFVNGPQRLKIVRNPSAFRSEATTFIAGCNIGAYRNTNPVSRRHSAARSGGRVIGTPSASSTSADPHCEVTARFPCLATFAPAAAATSAAPVETLKVAGPPPPVPQVSTSCSRSSPVSGIGVARARISSTKPATSGAISPRVASAVSSAAVSTSGTCSSRIAASAPRASSRVSCVPSSASGFNNDFKPDIHSILTAKRFTLTLVPLFHTMPHRVCRPFAAFDSIFLLQNNPHACVLTGSEGHRVGNSCVRNPNKP